MGAFIKIKSPIQHRPALLEVGIAGPIAGFVVALVVLVASLGLSKPLLAPSEIELGYPLIFELVHRLLASAGVSGRCYSVSYSPAKDAAART